MPKDNKSPHDVRPVFENSPAFSPPSSTAQVEFGARSRRGAASESNADHYAVIELGRYQKTLLTSLPPASTPARFEERGYAAVVADGVGEVGDGEAASRLALSTLLHVIARFSRWELRVDETIAQEVMQRADGYYRYVDSTMAERNRAEPRDSDRPRQRWRTTLTAVFGAGHDLFFAHVGHSRAYLSRDGVLMRLTRDHTIGAQGSRVPMAPLVDVSDAARDIKHILTDTIGMGGTLGPSIDVERFHLLDRDRVLVCSNGLTDTVDEERIGRILASALPPGEQCQLLVDAAAAAGGQDDATAVVAYFNLPD
ncbi:MAG TPA: protein phosphatase 2C domain-containing protein [Vicinamibacterales bacterium]